jgi:hypothetical protein
MISEVIVHEGSTSLVSFVFLLKPLVWFYYQKFPSMKIGR